MWFDAKIPTELHAMKKMFFVHCAFLILALIAGRFSPPLVSAYEVSTHKLISVEAINRSVLSPDRDVLKNLGLKPFLDEDGEFFPNSEGSQPKTILDLVQDGAGFEDDLPGSRFVHHFYDPVHDIPLTLAPGDKEGSSILFGGWLADPIRSPDWILEDRGDISVQEFSFKDARLHFLCALTGGTDPQCQAKGFLHTEQEWGRTFQTLGHLIHHIQDMAQPQHTRNERHPLSPQNIYEHYTACRHEDPAKCPADSPFPLTGYDPVSFDTAREFWVNEGKGLAEFSNTNFVTRDSNFILSLDAPRNSPIQESDIRPDPRYPSPNGLQATIIERDAGPSDLNILKDIGFLPIDPTPLAGKMYFVKTPITDHYDSSQSGDNDATSTYSIYDEDLLKYYDPVPYYDPLDDLSGPAGYRTRAIFSVNRFTMSAAHEFLIPRAVGYSAGLINYFFRGKLSVVTDAGPAQIKNDGLDPLHGTFTLYYDDAAGTRHPVFDEQGKPLSQPTPEAGLAAGTTMGLPAFDLPSNPAPKTAGEYMLVFQGDMGEEKAPRDSQGKRLAGGAVAAKVVTIPPPSFFTPAGRLRHGATGWELTPESGLQYGNVDWQGTAGSVSWVGPLGRHVRRLPAQALSPQIFSGGRLLANAPGPVLGAAIQQHPQTGTLTLLAVVATVNLTGEVIAETVYATPLPLLDPVQWVRLATFQEFFAHQYTTVAHFTTEPAHYFFNASGTQAVSVKKGSWGERGSIPVRLLFVDVAPGSAAFRFGPLLPEGTYETSSECLVPGEELCQYAESRTDWDYIVDTFAEYRGEELVEVRYAYREHYETHWTYEGRFPAFRWTKETVDYRRDHLETSSAGWQWPLLEMQGRHWDDEDSRAPDNSVDSHEESQRNSSLDRSLSYVDLRMALPVLGYLDRLWTGFDLFVEHISPEGVTEVVQNISTWEGQEQVAWEVAGRKHEVVPLQPIGEDSVFRDDQGTFAVGGSAAAPHVIANHRFPTTEVNFMYPRDDLRHYGGGPVGQ
jgi:hypothetical protein